MSGPTDEEAQTSVLKDTPTKTAWDTSNDATDANAEKTEPANAQEIEAPATGGSDEDNRVLGSCLSDRIQEAIGKLLSWHVRIAARRPLYSLLCSCFFIAAVLPGLAIMKTEAGDHIFFPRQQYSSRAVKRFRELFSDPKVTMLYAVADGTSDAGLFAPGVLKGVGRAVDEVLALRTAAGQTYAEICDKSLQGKCEPNSLLQYIRDSALQQGFSFAVPSGMAEFEALAVGVENFCSANADKCYSMLSLVNGLLVAGVGRGSDGSIQAKSLTVILSLDPLLKDSDDKLSHTELEKVILEKVHGPDYDSRSDDLQGSGFRFINMSEFAMQFESDRPVNKESHLMGIAFILVLAFLCCAITAPPGTGPRPRSLLGFSCMLVIILALTCALGICGYFGVPFTPMTSLMMFTLLGVAVDDIVIIVHTYDRCEVSESIAERMATSLQSSGSAITLTSVTSLTGLLSCSLVDLPAVRYFCIASSFGIMAVYVLTLTLFLPLFVWDEQRRNKGRLDCCLSTCFGSSATVSPEDSPDAEPNGDAAAAGDSDTKPTEAAPEKRGAKEWFVLVATAPAVGGGWGFFEGLGSRLAQNRYAQVAMVVTFLALTGASIKGAADIGTESDITSYFIDGSFIHDYYNTHRTLYASRSPYYLTIDHSKSSGEGFPSDAYLTELNSLVADLKGLDCVFGPEENWLTSFEAYLARNYSGTALTAERARLHADPVAFGKSVSIFLNVGAFVDGAGRLIRPWQLKRHVVIHGGVVKYSRIQLQYEEDLKVQARYISNFKKQHRVVFPDGDNGKFEGARVPNTFEISLGFAMRAGQRDDVLKGVIIENLALSVAAVTFVVAVMLNPAVGLFVGIIVIAIDAIIVAMLSLIGNQLDLVGFVCLCMTIGLTVDYSIHTVHAYMHQSGDPDDRLYHTLSSMGASITSGGGSTLLGLFALAFASSEAFRSFFRVLGTAIALGTAVGVLVSPLLLRCCHSGFLLLTATLQKSRGKEVTG